MNTELSTASVRTMKLSDSLQPFQQGDTLLVGHPADARDGDWVLTEAADGALLCTMYDRLQWHGELPLGLLVGYYRELV